MYLWAFVKALWKYWWASISSAALTIVALYGLARGESNKWVLFVSTVTAIAMFLVAAFLAWNAECERRLKAESAFDWLEIGTRFKELNDGGAVIARWIQDSKTKEYKWEVMGGSRVYSLSCTEMCRQAGRRFVDSKTLRSKFPEIATIVDDGDRWLVLIRENLLMAESRGTLSSIQGVDKQEAEFGELPNLTGASHALCLRLSNEERSSAPLRGEKL